MNRLRSLALLGLTAGLLFVLGAPAGAVPQ